MKLLLLTLFVVLTARARANEVLTVDSTSADKKEELALQEASTEAFNTKDLEIAKASLAAAKAFTELFNIKLLEGPIQEKAQLISKILTFSISIVNLIQHQQAAESAEIKYLREQFAALHVQLDRIELKIEDVKRLIEWSSTRAMYANYEVFIIAASSTYDDYLKAPPSTREVLKQRFLQAFQHNRFAPLKLYQGIVEKDFVIAENLGTAVVHYTQNHRRHVVSFLLAMQRLILRGAELEIAYERLVRDEVGGEAAKTVWEDRMKKLLTRMQSIDNQVKSQYLTQMSTDLDVHIGSTGHLGHVDFVRTVFPIIKDKFDFRKWVLCSYVPVWGGDIHTVSVCGGTHRFRAHGNRNVVIASSDPRTSRFTIASGNAALDFAQQMHSGWFAVHWNEWIRRAAPDCNSAALVFTLRGPHFVNCGYTDDSSFVYRRIFKDGDMQAMVFG